MFQYHYAISFSPTTLLQSRIIHNNAPPYTLCITQAKTIQEVKGPVGPQLLVGSYLGPRACWTLSYALILGLDVIVVVFVVLIVVLILDLFISEVGEILKDYIL